MLLATVATVCAVWATAPQAAALAASRRTHACIAWEVGLRLVALCLALPASFLCGSGWGWESVLAAQALVLYGLVARVHLAFFHPLRTIPWPIGIYIKVRTRANPGGSLLTLLEVLPSCVRTGRMGTTWRVRSPSRVPAEGIEVRKKPRESAEVTNSLRPLDIVEVDRGAKKWVRVAGGWAQCMKGKCMWMDPFYLLPVRSDSKDRGNCSICTEGESPDCTPGPGCVLRKLSCGHLFHPECIQEWFNNYNTCPDCKGKKLQRRAVLRHALKPQAASPKGYSRPRPNQTFPSLSRLGNLDSSSGVLSGRRHSEEIPRGLGEMKVVSVFHEERPERPSKSLSSLSGIFVTDKMEFQGSSSQLEKEFDCDEGSSDFPSLSSINLQPTDLQKMVNRLNGIWTPEDKLLTRGHLYTLAEDDEDEY